MIVKGSPGPGAGRSPRQGRAARGWLFGLALAIAAAGAPAIAATPPPAASGWQPADTLAWDSLAVALRAARRAARCARMQLVPAEILKTETACAGLLHEAADCLRDIDARALPARPSLGFLIDELLVARDPTLLSLLTSLSPEFTRALDSEGALSLRVACELLRGGHSQEAAGLLETGLSSRLRPYGDLLDLEALEGTDSARAGQWAAALLREQPRHRFAGALTLAAARHALALGDAAAAESLLAAFLGTGDGDTGVCAAAQTLLGESHRRQGRSADSRDAFLRAAELSAGERSTGPTRAALASEILRSPNLLSSYTIRMIVAVFCELGRVDDALSAWQGHEGALAPADRRAAGRRLQQALYRLRRMSELRSVAMRMEGSGDRAAAIHGALMAGRSWRGQDMEAMAAAYERAARRALPEDSLSAQECEDAAFALWELARELEDAGKWRSAQDAYGRLARRFPGDSHARDAALHAALCLERAGDRAGAVSELTRLCNTAPADQLGGPCLWLAFLAEPQERPAHLERAARETNPGYYARRARWDLERGYGGEERDSLFWPRLAREVRDPGSWSWPQTKPVLPDSVATRLLDAIENHSYARTGRLLLSGGRAEWAREFWGLLPGWDALTADERAALLRGLEDQGEGVRAGIRGGGRAARYPVAFAPEIAAAARRFSLSPALILAVMRQESLLETQVRSAAGACGLMQLMPATAERMAAALGWQSFDLDRPGDNILMGACHLAELLDWSGGELPVALAAYNGGPEAAARWRPRADNLDGYLEMIGYQETRRFVRSVLTHYGFLGEIYPAD